MIGQKNCIIVGDMVHECDGTVRAMAEEERNRLREQRDQAKEDFKQVRKELPQLLINFTVLASSRSSSLFSLLQRPYRRTRWQLQSTIYISLFNLS